MTRQNPMMTAVTRSELMKFLAGIVLYKQKQMEELKGVENLIGIKDKMVATIVKSIKGYVTHEARTTPTNKTRTIPSKMVDTKGFMRFFRKTKRIPSRTVTDVIPVSSNRISKDVKEHVDRVLELSGYEAATVNVQVASSINWSSPIYKSRGIYISDFQNGYEITVRMTRSYEHESLIKKLDDLKTQLREIRELHGQLLLSEVATKDGSDTFMSVEDYAKLKVMI